VSRGAVPRRHGLALRIYVVSAAALLAVLLALYVFAIVIFGPPHHGGPLQEMARYAASKVGERWSSPDAVARELEAVRVEMNVRTAAYRWDGTLVAANTDAPLPPLAPGERSALASSPVVERRGEAPDRHQLAVVVPGVEGPLGYIVLENLDRPRPPPLGTILAVLLVVALGVPAALLGRAIARPLERLAHTAQALGAGDLKARTGLARRDELGALARAFDDMAERVEKLVLSQTELLANVAHELRTPLARIRMALELAEGGDPAVARESLTEIAQDLSELEGLVNDILASARMDIATSTTSGGPPLRRAPLAVAHVVSGAVERLRHRHPARRVEVDVAPDLPEVEGDAVLLRRALDNLLDNAQKYSPPDSAIRLRAGRSRIGVVVDVIDSGEGISAEDLSRLFTPFFRGDKSRTRGTGGVGLGLSLARRIVEAHGGTLTAASTPRVGTTMSVELPAPGATR
jgi:signal transduction histidine kinase